MTALALLLACRASPPPEVTDVEVRVDEALPTVLHVSWSFDGPALHAVAYGRGGVLDEVTPSSEVPELDVLGLVAGETYTLQAIVETPNGERITGEPVAVTLEPPPADLPALDVTLYDPAAADPGRFVMVTLGDDDVAWVAILDRDGRWVWWHRVEEGMQAVTSKPARDGRTLLASVYDRGQLEDLGRIAHLDVRGGPVRSTTTLLAHHDFAELPDGSLAWLATDVRDVDVEGQVRPMATDRILEMRQDAEDDSPVEVFSVFDDLGRAPWFPCDHARHLDPTPLGEAYNYTHGNSLIASADGGAFYYHARYLDALLRIDRATGEIQWQLGGEDSDFTVLGPGGLWDHGHASQIWDGGMVMFDNASHRDPPVSGFAEYAWDESTREVREVFRYDSPDGWEVGALGDARRLPSGNYMVTWGSLGVLQEVTPSGTIVWEVAAPPGTLVSRFTLYRDLYDLGYSTR